MFLVNPMHSQVITLRKGCLKTDIISNFQCLRKRSIHFRAWYFADIIYKDMIVLYYYFHSWRFASFFLLTYVTATFLLPGKYWLLIALCYITFIQKLHRNFQLEVSILSYLGLQQTNAAFLPPPPPLQIASRLIILTWVCAKFMTVLIARIVN